MHASQSLSASESQSCCWFRFPRKSIKHTWGLASPGLLSCLIRCLIVYATRVRTVTMQTVVVTLVGCMEVGRGGGMVKNRRNLLIKLEQLHCVAFLPFPLLFMINCHKAISRRPPYCNCPKLTNPMLQTRRPVNANLSPMARIQGAPFKMVLVGCLGAVSISNDRRVSHNDLLLQGNWSRSTGLQMLACCC